jgi:hypothetical protein
MKGFACKEQLEPETTNCTTIPFILVLSAFVSSAAALLQLRLTGTMLVTFATCCYSCNRSNDRSQQPFGQL